MSCLACAERLMFEAAARAVRPRERMPFAEWLPKSGYLPDGPQGGNRFSYLGAPYLREIAEVLDPDHPSTYVAVRKSQQVGVSVLGFLWASYLAEHHPANILYAAPSNDSLDTASNNKLQRIIDLMEERRGLRIFRPVTSRSGTGSTTRNKRFAGGTMYLANANSATDLSSNTMRFGIFDEVSKWENIPVYGDPEKLARGRFTAYEASQMLKILAISTPELDAGDINADWHCRIDRHFQRSDQRYYHIVCPHCGDRFTPTMDLVTVDRDDPRQSMLYCDVCGSGLTDWQRIKAIGHPESGWVAAREGKGLQPGFHLDALVSKMVPLSLTASEYLDQERRDQQKKKAFSTLFLGRPYAMRGDAPEPEKLADRPKTIEAPRIVPDKGLILTMGVDVQHNGLVFEMLAIGEDRQNWSLDVGFISGGTDIANQGAWAELNTLIETPLEDVHGRARHFDCVMIDAGDGGRANQVYAFTRRLPNVHAIKGVGRADAPAVSGAPTIVDIKLDGKRIKQGAKLWKVGTWSLKAEFFALLARQREDGVFPPGYCHMGDWNDLSWAKQITAEYLTTVKVAGRQVQRWVESGPNHFLDARIYAMAAAEKMGISRMTRAKWALLRESRGAPQAGEPDLFASEAERLAGNQSHETTKSKMPPAPRKRRPKRRIYNPLTGRYVGD